MENINIHSNLIRVKSIISHLINKQWERNKNLSLPHWKLNTIVFGNPYAVQKKLLWINFIHAPHVSVGKYYYITKQYNIT